MTDILRSTSLHDLLRVVMCPANGYAEPSDYFTEIITYDNNDNNDNNNDDNDYNVHILWY